MCKRCGGLAVGELADDGSSGMAGDASRRLRCLNCGDIEDAVILANRTSPPPMNPLAGPRLRNWTKPGLAVKLKGGRLPVQGRPGRRAQGPDG